jgi:hypothetical protein
MTSAYAFRWVRAALALSPMLLFSYPQNARGSTASLFAEAGTLITERKLEKLRREPSTHAERPYG